MKKTELNESTLTSRLSQLQKLKGLSKMDMAKIAGVSPQSVNGWFKRGSISKTSAMKLSTALDVSLSWLLGEGGDQQSELSADEMQLIEIYRQLGASEKRNMLAAFEMRLQEIKDYYEKYAAPNKPLP
ncbi:helix-turn-helix domain-containing protein [Erwinia phyllosphaerae]|uniref:helix-turn-helix domain-containing protein n=1 Tax=Erwinia phyllosphaerae TaxID=2853256 RepID=UPI001FEF47ED|nr:helix-turn-helix domain-containing protein [Erwinia phyllosphaerae]MBV4366257.1 helix-turn-helix domain-containing protein [Erwinia phyllosphaerae]